MLFPIFPDFFFLSSQRFFFSFLRGCAGVPIRAGLTGLPQCSISTLAGVIRRNLYGSKFFTFQVGTTVGAFSSMTIKARCSGFRVHGFRRIIRCYGAVFCFYSTLYTRNTHAMLRVVRIRYNVPIRKHNCAV
jgi:hypothetical protein